MLKKICFLIISLFVIFFSSHFFVNAELGDWKSNLEKTAGSGGAGYDIDQKNPLEIVSNIIQIALSFLGVIFLVLTIYGGFLWMTAAGDESKVESARKMITAAIIGLIIVVSAYAISYFVMSKLIEKTLTV